MAMTEMKGLPPPVEVYPEAGGPSLADLGPCPLHEREPLARFLLESSTLMAAPMRLPDPLDPGRGNVMSAHINTDGECTGRRPGAIWSPSTASGSPTNS